MKTYEKPLACLLNIECEDILKKSGELDIVPDDDDETEFDPRSIKQWDLSLLD